MKVNNVKTVAAVLARRSLMTAALVVAPAMSSLFVGALAPAELGVWQLGQVQAQELIKPATERPETRRVPGLKQSLNEDLSEVQELVDPQEEGNKPNLPRALEKLQDMEDEIDSYNPYEQAQIFNFLANVHFQLDNMDKTIEYFRKVVANSPQIPTGLEASSWQVLGKLHMQEEEWDQALEAFNNWAAMVNSISASQYYSLSLLFYQMGDLDRALVHVNQAVNMHEQDDKVPEENWYAMQRLLYYEKEDYFSTIEVLKKMVRHYPKISTWRQLSDLYSLTEQFDRRLHTLEVVYLLDGLDKENVLLSLASMYLERDYPYKAGKILNRGIYESEIIEPTSDNLQLLANSWSLAQETDDALVEMEKAAEKSDDGELYARLAGLYTLQERYDDAIEAGEEALERGVDRPDQVHMRIGTAYVNMGEYDKAIESLRVAAKDKRSQQAARQWIRYSEKEQEREERLAQEKKRIEEMEKERQERDGLVLPSA